MFGAANGRMARPVNLAQALTPFGVGLMLTWTGGYSGSLRLLAGLGVAAGLTLLGMARIRTDVQPGGQALTKRLGGWTRVLRQALAGAGGKSSGPPV
ncbi:hypothetical protein GCM10008955_41650 [Deinococcus malanensis]|uniref:MFS transporter n=1 Tax=Deinococcus malanensis TaxID=1706855 RepID=A0ABQ2F2S7_9DEIO|nr:hypothetical protein GCM10008955_41650 [Deinococcus malanensis]